METRQIRGPEMLMSRMKRRLGIDKQRISRMLGRNLESQNIQTARRALF
jgi:SOS response regulatory protein OraA/RecX